MITLPITGTQRTMDVAPAKIIAVGLNYREHVKESLSFDHNQLGIPKEPVLFSKTPNVLIGPGEPIVLPEIADSYAFPEPRTDPEAELAVIIGKRGRHIREEDAYDYVFGYTCFNDVSQRNIQKSDVSGWFRGKSFDTFGPIGPAVVLRENMPDPQNLAISSRINGELKQSASTADMMFSIPFLIAYISRNVTLEAGDIIATGTPSGISPIKPGDVVEIEIEGIGVLRNPVAAEQRR
ncbi:fumarylacetoacetate hydrolase family protein [Breznakiella homolactica]|uniref:Fumarylacetoacetate hydrolase family protein n=1 Tax=Breznakiella homolactica TaxID=2798577 RepID=A0A7T7XKV7_9SPIR|nr:fumarylacetoacetate hydrolase family protein [Breznakiella homolactica]QQO08279.1 fumarylacetoacetate hydrolase family protein [Breznakiella homolactica]